MPKRKLPPTEEVIRLYREGFSSGELAERWNVSPLTVVSCLRTAGEPRRTAQEAAQVKILAGRTRPASYWLGKKQPAEMVEKRAAAIRGEKHWLRQPESNQHSVSKERVLERLRATQFNQGEHASPDTEFKKDQHWRPAKPFRDAEYLRREYQENCRSTAEIAAEHGVTGAAIAFWLHKHGIERRTMSEVRAFKYWGATGEANPMFGRRGAESPSWRGGSTPERQAFYSSIEWRRAARFVRKRDKSSCQRCGLKWRKGIKLCIHHVVSFSVAALRIEPTNLVLLCDECHRWVHSPKNVAKEYRREGGG